MNPDRIELSYIIPSNNLEFLDKTIHSIINQNCKPLSEIIIVFNGLSKLKIENWRTDLRFKKEITIVYSKVGRSQARNEGARCARGDYLAFIDSDIELDCSWTKINYNSLKNYWIDIALGEIEIFPKIKYSQSYEINLNKILSHDGIIIDTAAFMIKKEVFFTLGRFDENFKRAEDIRFTLKAFYDGAVISYNQSKAIKNINTSYIFNFFRLIEVGYWTGLAFTGFKKNKPVLSKLPVKLGFIFSKLKIDKKKFLQDYKTHSYRHYFIFNKTIAPTERIFFFKEEVICYDSLADKFFLVEDPQKIRLTNLIKFRKLTKDE